MKDTNKRSHGNIETFWHPQRSLSNRKGRMHMNTKDHLFCVPFLSSDWQRPPLVSYLSIFPCDLLFVSFNRKSLHLFSKNGHFCSYFCITLWINIRVYKIINECFEAHNVANEKNNIERKDYQIERVFIVAIT